MELFILIGILIITLIIISIIFDVNLKNLKNIKSLGEDTKLSEITNKLPNNIEVCKKILKKLNNIKVKVEENKDSSTSLYIVLTDKIHIANVKDSFTRIQTIAHECLHSVQNRKILLFNYYFSNAYLIYFVFAIIMLILKQIQYKQICIAIFIVLSFIYYFVRAYLENDAMIKARYVAKEYMEEENVLSKKEIDEVVTNYDKINSIGIKCVNFNLLFGTFVKIIILSIICIVR